MQLPSGRTLSEFDIELLRGMHSAGFVRYSEQPITLKSKISSHVYVAGREDLTESPELMRQVGRKICDLIEQNRLPTDMLPCLIGIPTAGTILAVAASIMSQSRVQPLPCRVMREVRKSHGLHKTWVTGAPAPSRHTYWLLDNVATDGKSKLEAEKKLIEDGYPPKPPLLIWIDRQQGAVKDLAEDGFTRIVVGYNLLDLAYAYGELKLWPRETIKLVEDEIAAHHRIFR